MKPWAIILLAMAVLAVGSVHGAKEVAKRRTRRNVMNFGLMIKCTTNRNPTDYNMYGCHCGAGGSGTPVDAVDSCCLHHDACWEQVQKKHGCERGHFAVYNWKCQTDRPVDCEQNKDACGRGYCMCDAEAAMCFARHRYAEYYRNWNGGCRQSSQVATPDWLRQVMQAMHKIPADFIPHLGRQRASAPAAGAAAPAAARGPAQVPPAANKPVMISLPGTGPDLPGNPGHGSPAAAPAPVKPDPPHRSTPRQPPPEKRGISLPNIIGSLLKGPWRAIFGGK